MFGSSLAVLRRRKILPNDLRHTQREWEAGERWIGKGEREREREATRHDDYAYEDMYVNMYTICAHVDMLIDRFRLVLC